MVVFYLFFLFFSPLVVIPQELKLLSAYLTPWGEGGREGCKNWFPSMLFFSSLITFIPSLFSLVVVMTGCGGKIT